MNYPIKLKAIVVFLVCISFQYGYGANGCNINQTDALIGANFVYAPAYFYKYVLKKTDQCHDYCQVTEGSKNRWLGYFMLMHYWVPRHSLNMAFVSVRRSSYMPQGRILNSYIISSRLLAEHDSDTGFSSHRNPKSFPNSIEVFEGSRFTHTTQNIYEYVCFSYFPLFHLLESGENEQFAMADAQLCTGGDHRPALFQAIETARENPGQPIPFEFQPARTSETFQQIVVAYENQDFSAILAENKNTLIILGVPDHDDTPAVSSGYVNGSESDSGSGTVPNTETLPLYYELNHDAHKSISDGVSHAIIGMLSPHRPDPVIRFSGEPIVPGKNLYLENLQWLTDEKHSIYLPRQSVLLETNVTWNTLPDHEISFSLGEKHSALHVAIESKHIFHNSNGQTVSGNRCHLQLPLQDAELCNFVFSGETYQSNCRIADVQTLRHGLLEVGDIDLSGSGEKPDTSLENVVFLDTAYSKRAYYSGSADNKAAYFPPLPEYDPALVTAPLCTPPVPPTEPTETSQAAPYSSSSSSAMVSTTSSKINPQITSSSSSSSSSSRSTAFLQTVTTRTTSPGIVKISTQTYLAMTRSAWQELVSPSVSPSVIPLATPEISGLREQDLTPVIITTPVLAATGIALWTAATVASCAGYHATGRNHRALKVACYIFSGATAYAVDLMMSTDKGSHSDNFELGLIKN
ncbi:hypothetical protein [Endozoicomonas numazuensis]|uniref:Uncharacterized protein n=1 Tax=Endozoicomonas numazuensis TaxID=1137799 RepID=A0A081NJV0_9GAMM|nr:hypothetical protein [Endozoicomonas numazuensis]KEQ18723.1 hypothetical protein GZ78_01025 [Endozoicomonas numazuensis]